MYWAQTAPHEAMMASQPSSFLHNRFVSMIGRPRTHQRITDTLRWMINLTSLILRSKACRKQEQTCRKQEQNGEGHRNTKPHASRWSDREVRNRRRDSCNPLSGTVLNGRH